MSKQINTLTQKFNRKKVDNDHCHSIDEPTKFAPVLLGFKDKIHNQNSQILIETNEKTFFLMGKLR